MRLAGILVVAACYHGDAGPPPPTCTAAAEHVRALVQPARQPSRQPPGQSSRQPSRQPSGARANRIRDVFAVRCSEDAWSDEVRACVVDTTSLGRPRGCKAKLTVEQRAALDKDLAAVSAMENEVSTPEVCNDFRALVEKLRTCTAVDPEVRVKFTQGYRQLTLDWALGTFDAHEVEDHCRRLASGLRQVARGACGW